MSSFRSPSSALPTLPLLLWDTPPGLEMILRQEGVAFQVVREPHPLAFRAGRFVVYDGRTTPLSRLRAWLGAEHVAIDLDRLRDGLAVDPLAALIETRSALSRWELEGYGVVERIARVDRAALRELVLSRLREAVVEAGGLWARLAPFPFPYRSAFNLRVDLDEEQLDDYARFARARRRFEDCVTHFVSTAAYADHPAVMQDLLRFDTQSHGHHHVIYRGATANRRNLARAHDLLADSGFQPVGFAAPHGRWNVGLDQVLEDLGYVYSSDFQVGYDDVPFLPWCGDRFSRVLQVPIHPVCEGVFFEAGATRGRPVAEHLARVVRARIEAGEPAFVYGHPERRLARHPEIFQALEGAIAGESLLWRTTLTDFALWWRWRLERRWAVVPRGEGRFEVQFDDWCPQFPLGLEVVRGSHSATVPIHSSRTPLALDAMAYVRRPEPADLPRPSLLARSLGLKALVREALDWETVTPLDELPADTIAARVKKSLRRWRQARRQEVEP